jgi:hypothetical protein
VSKSGGCLPLPLPYSSLPLFNGGPGVEPPEKFLIDSMLVGEFYSIFDTKLHTLNNHDFMPVNFDFFIVFSKTQPVQAKFCLKLKQTTIGL